MSKYHKCRDCGHEALSGEIFYRVLVKDRKVRAQKIANGESVKPYTLCNVCANKGKKFHIVGKKKPTQAKEAAE